MANLPETPVWETGIYQLEETDPVQGGPNGIDNQQGKQLANRTAWLKSQVETLGTGKQPLAATHTAIAALNGVADRIAYFTGPDTVALTPLTAFIRTLLDDGDASAARSTLGAISQTQLDAAISALVNSSPATLDTLNELAAALGNDANFATTVTNALAAKAPIASPVFTGDPKGPTPAQFDNDTSMATTEFVQRALGNFQGFREPSVNTTLDASDVGKVITVNNATITLTLPDADNLATGSAITICNVSPQSGAIVTVQRQGADQIWVGTGQGLTSFTLAPNESVTLVRQTANAWKQVSGQVGFGSSLAASGYQKLPSGLIVQWVQGATSTAGEVSEVVTLPITFPNSNLFSSVSSLNAAASPAADTNYQVVSKTTSQVTVFRQQNPGNSVALAPLVFAIGY